MNDATKQALRDRGGMVGSANEAEWSGLVEQHGIDGVCFAIAKARGKASPKGVTVAQVSDELGKPAKQPKPAIAQPVDQVEVQMPPVEVIATIDCRERKRHVFLFVDQLDGELTNLLEQLIDAYEEHHEVVILPQYRARLTRAAIAVFGKPE